MAAARGREQSTRDESDERIKIAFAQYYAVSRQIGVDRNIVAVARRMNAAASARYGQGGGSQADIIQALSEETTAKIEIARLEGERSAIRARLNTLIARPVDAPLAEPVRLPVRRIANPDLNLLLERARAANPTLSAGGAEIDAARARQTLADKAWYPDLTIGAGPLIQTNHQPVGVAATIGFNIPVPWGREASQQREAAAQLSATQQRYRCGMAQHPGCPGGIRGAVAGVRATRKLCCGVRPCRKRARRCSRCSPAMAKAKAILRRRSPPNIALMMSSLY